MIKLNNSHKILSLLLLGSILISILMLPNFNNTTISTSEQKSPTQNNITPDQKSPTQDDISPKLSAPPPAPRYNQTFNITQSEDDAYSSAVAKTVYDTVLHVGCVSDPDNGFSTGTALRWNITVPNNANIINAYINLTVANLTFYEPIGAPTFNGTDTYISAFNYPSTDDFSDTYEVLKGRELIPSVPSYLWKLNGTELVNQTIKTINIADLLEKIMVHDDWDGIFGAWIRPDAGTEWLEHITFWSYDNGKPEYYPKLFVEWDYTPHFTDLPTPKTINNETLGYYILWKALDNNPTTYTIIGNESLTGPPTEITGTWQSGKWIIYSIPKIDIENYDSVTVKYTITVFDADGYSKNNSVLINVTDKGLPTMTALKFIQNNREVDHFQPDDGPFSVRIYCKQAAKPKVTLTASYPNYDFEIWKEKFFSKPNVPINVCLWMEPDTVEAFTYKTDDPQFEYNSELGCWELTPTIDKYKWVLYFYYAPALLYVTDAYDYYIPVQDIRYNVNNKFTIGIDEVGNPEFVCEGRIYGGGKGALRYEILNDDLTPPIFTEPEFIEPDEPDKHYEITINVAPEENGAVVADVFLYYSVDDGVWEETKMVLRALGEIKYYGEIPPQAEGSKITYYIRIVDKAGNVVETDEYTEKASVFEETSPIVPIIGVCLGVLTALSIVVIYRHKNKKAFKKLSSEKISKKSTKKGNKLIQKIKKVRNEQ